LTAGNYSSPNHQEDGYITFDASLGYEQSDGLWSIRAYVRNIEDEAVYIQASDNSNVPSFSAEDRSAAAGIGSPRTYGVRLQYNF